jgi:radical SAM superfamily enzyme YgiQ (UPF0313 family)
MKISFINPPHADWCLVNNLTWLCIQSYYKEIGKNNHKVMWMEAPYKWDKYNSIDDVIQELIDADVILFSSYSWNYDICDAISKKIKELYPEKTLILGGPHIGTNDLNFLNQRKQYDLICQPTKPGELFMLDFIDNNPNISWELNSLEKKSFVFSEKSVYREHIDYLKKLKKYSEDNNLESLIVLETTRGCPFACTFCEWGGGTETKIIKKNLETVKEDILAIKEAGYVEVYLADANFGVFEDRDFEIFDFANRNGIIFTDVSTLKTKDLNRRIRLLDFWFNVVGKQNNNKLSVPNISIQSLSDEAMTVAKRLDLSCSDKLKLGKYIHEKCHEEGYPIPSLEFILAMPGSTIKDFYDEFDVIADFKSWGTVRHDYMFLPDTELCNPNYLKNYNIKLVEVYTDLVDEGGVENKNTLYKNKRNYFKTISECYSFTKQEMVEMFIMNIAGPFLLKEYHHMFDMKASDFIKRCYLLFKELKEFEDLEKEVINIFDTNTKPKSIKKIGGQLRNNYIQTFIKKYDLLIRSEFFEFC